MKILPLSQLLSRPLFQKPLQKPLQKLLFVKLFLYAFAVPGSLMLSTSAALGGNIFIEPVQRSSQPFSLPTTSRLPIPSSDIFCSYSPGDSRLGRDAVITLIESRGDSTFRYERLNDSRSAAVSSFSLAPNATVSRTITFRNTTANQAGRRLINRPDEYANLLGVSTADPIVSAGFGAIAPQFTCQPFDSAIRTATEFSTDNLPPLTRQARSLAALPDGNYRVASPAAIAGVDTTDAYSASTLFTFRKLGDVVTGNFEYLNGDRKACIRGNITGNTITGEAYTDSGETFVLGQRYLGPSLSLALGEAVTFRRYDASVLDLNGFTRISAGTTQPPVGCV